MNVSRQVEEVMMRMTVFAEQKKHEFMTPEHLLYALLFDQSFSKAFHNCGGSIKVLQKDLEDYFEKNINIIDRGQPAISYQLNELLVSAEARAAACEKFVVELSHIVSAFALLENNYALYFIQKQEIAFADLLYELCEELEENELYDDDMEFFEEPIHEDKNSWQEYVTCMNDSWETYPPLIGRESELERTMQILCRKEKNNPLHIGEPGVGKTAIVKGFVRKIERQEVPELLKGARVFSLDMGTMLAGTQYRGDFEKRFQKVMRGLEKEEKPIVYLDEIHNIVGAGSVNGGSMDAANLLKEYLTGGHIRFIGATTHEEYNKYFSKDKSLVRRFQTVDIKEPSVAETIEILNGLIKSYEKYHHVKYRTDVLEHATVLSNKYINERFLPDKAIDLIDEAGAFRNLHPLERKVQSVDKKLIEEILSKTCNIPKQTVEADELQQLVCLEENLKKEIFGQDEAIHLVVNAVKLSRSGLNMDKKPVACLLFAGPTGVGKTEIARCLAKQLGIELVRFDMSEYTQKHTVAKLIGAPAGYVGYEEGGLLTDAVRKTPHCVLLLDEIEKAHSDIYNVLLQLMDYATLTDSQGKRADFRNVILIMTSNAGAKNIGKKMIGFGERKLSMEAIDDEIKKIFSPEFRNRLSKVVKFNFVNSEMADKIIDKQLRMLEAKLSVKQIQVNITPAVKAYLKENGVNDEFGARQIEHLIQNEIKPVFVDQILFGTLKKGGRCILDYGKEGFTCRIVRKKVNKKVKSTV